MQASQLSSAAASLADYFLVVGVDEENVRAAIHDNQGTREEEERLSAEGRVRRRRRRP